MPRTRHSLFDYLDESDQRLVREFFAAFAAAEYDLKIHGFIRRGSEDAQADWDAYAKAIRQRFRVDRPPAIAKAWRKLTVEPPRKQVIRKGRLAWLETPRAPRTSDAEYGLLLVRRVRNNLFHGAKFILGGSGQVTRDRDLVAAAHTVLEHAMALLPSTRAAA